MEPPFTICFLHCKAEPMSPLHSIWKALLEAMCSKLTPDSGGRKSAQNSLFVYISHPVLSSVPAPSFSTMNSRHPVHVAYNQQTNNQFNDRRSLHNSSTRMIFNGPIHGYIEHVTGEGPVIAYSEVTYVERGHKKFSQTTLFSEQKGSSVPAPASPPSRRPIKTAAEDNRSGETVLDGSALISPSIPLPIDRSVLETEFRQVSPDMQKYIKYLLHQYEKSYNEKNGHVDEVDQR